MIIELLRHFGTISVSNTRRAGMLGLVCLSFIVSSCMTVGQEFPESHVSDIRIGKTTQTEVRNMFGSPWRVGVENGQRTWTYGKYHYQLVGPSEPTANGANDIHTNFADCDITLSTSGNIHMAVRELWYDVYLSRRPG